jgi:P4 family phage/plasmid primase-like protien
MSSLSEFLFKHNAVKMDKSNNASTHTRIGSHDLNIHGGSFRIEPEELQLFHRLYYEHIFVKNNNEYLTEKQLENAGPILVDFDFRYDYSVTERQHNEGHIIDMVQLYLEELKNIVVITDESEINIYVFEKPNVNRVADKNITKDGIHMIIGVHLEHTIQLMLRQRIIEKIGSIWELPLTNSWESVLDEGISKGTTNWQLYGSRKPDNEAYKMTNHYHYLYNNDEDIYITSERDIEEFNLATNFIQISAQNPSNPKFELNPKIMVKYKNACALKQKASSGGGCGSANMNFRRYNYSSGMGSRYDLITNNEELDAEIKLMLDNVSSSEYEIREIHEYTQILPEKYYCPGSHLLNRQVAFALKRTDERLFLSWIKLRSKADDFDFGTISSLYQLWGTAFNKKNVGITSRSIMYWAKQDASPEDYIRVKHNCVNTYVDISIQTQTEFDVANVLHKFYKDMYVCTSIKNKQWFLFKDHKWVNDKGYTLRLAISTTIHNIYYEKASKLYDEISAIDVTDEENSKKNEKLKRRHKSIMEMCGKLKKTNDKNNIFREAMELFYDGDFMNNLDANKMLLCCNNGVIDFATKTFRNGSPQDYLSKSTGIDYVKLDKEIHQESMDDIMSFMEKLFPIPELNTYMWDHLASCLIGINKNQTFNIYCGSGSNGKSILTDLMTHTLGEYKGTVPITLVTEKRGSIGGTSSEIIQLKGIRYAVMQEPSKDMTINEGIMKELTGGDPVQGRALYCDSETFEPQFKLVVCTNSLFKVNSQDDGTWRRIRLCNFMSKFIDADETHTDTTQYIFEKDKTLKERLPKLAPVFLAMLTELTYVNEGNVKDCNVVKLASNKYRDNEDLLSKFVKEQIINTGVQTDTIKKTEFVFEMKSWLAVESGGSKKQPSAREMHDVMEKHYGPCKNNMWTGVKMQKYATLTDDDPNAD